MKISLKLVKTSVFDDCFLLFIVVMEEKGKNRENVPDLETEIIVKNQGIEKLELNALQSENQ